MEVLLGQVQSKLQQSKDEMKAWTATNISQLMKTRTNQNFNTQIQQSAKLSELWNITTVNRKQSNQ